MTNRAITGRSLVAGTATGELLVSDVGLSFWGGVDPVTGLVIDQHHPLRGEHLAGRVLAIPSGRGSCSGSGALLELLLNEQAPAALLFSQHEEILTLGVVVAAVMFERSIPVVLLQQKDFDGLRNSTIVEIHNQHLYLAGSATSPAPGAKPHMSVPDDSDDRELTLSESDKSMLCGEQGKAAKVAMQVVTQMARIQGADSFIDISQAHIDAVVYNGPSSLRFARQLADWGAEVKVPTTLNSLSVDKQRWQQQGVDPAFGKPASELGDAYLEMGAIASFTCAPYLLDTAPAAGDQIVWAESNAVVYANSVLGARTQKYPDFLDICIALTARAPATGSHFDSGRLPGVVIRVERLESADDAFWPLLGYHTGLLSENTIPLVLGLEHLDAGTDALKAFCAAFATTSSTPMVHLAGHTPEAASAEQYLASKQESENSGSLQELEITTSQLQKSWYQLNTATEPRVDLVCLGNPHFSLSECATLAGLCEGQVKHEKTRIIVTLGRTVHQAAIAAGHVAALEDFGAEFITDTCWCMINEPIIADTAHILMTNSGKYAHYGPGLVDRKIYFDNLAACVQAAVTGQHHSLIPDWLRQS